MTAQLSKCPWQDRWSEPAVNELLKPLKAHHRRVFEHLIEQFNAMENVSSSLIWYGPAWKWTLEYRLGEARQDPSAPDDQTLCYLVPRLGETTPPLVCVPLPERLAKSLPLNKLSKFIREGVKSAKCAVDIHWANWSANTVSEAKEVVDLIERRMKFAESATDDSAEA